MWAPKIWSFNDKGAMKRQRASEHDIIQKYSPWTFESRFTGFIYEKNNRSLLKLLNHLQPLIRAY